MKSIKSILTAFLSVMVALRVFVPALAAFENITVTINGKDIWFDVLPQIINDRTMVPMRTIFEELGSTVDWNDTQRSISANKGDTSIWMQIDNPTMIVDGENITLDAPPVIIDGRTLVPVRAIAVALDCYVDWLESIKNVRIEDKYRYGSVYPTFTDVTGIEPSGVKQDETGEYYTYTADESILEAYAEKLVSEYGFHKVDWEYSSRSLDNVDTIVENLQIEIWTEDDGTTKIGIIPNRSKSRIVLDNEFLESIRSSDYLLK